MKTTLLLLLLSLVTVGSFTQNNIGINNPNPDPSAVLDVTSSSKGLLIPRMNTAQRLSIVSPANALLVFDTDNNSFWYYHASKAGWISLNTGIGSIISDSDGNTYVTVEAATNDDTIRFFIEGDEKFKFHAKGIEVVNNSNSLFIGEESGKNSFTSLNTGVGSRTLADNTFGSKNTAVGSLTLEHNTTGTENTAVGALALRGNNGDRNIALGNSAMAFNWSGSDNTAIGNKALFSNYDGNYNIAIGSKALYDNNRSYNIGIGDSTLVNNGQGATLDYHGTENTAVGSRSMAMNSTGHKNTAFGFRSMYSNTTGQKNVAVGADVMFTNSTGVNNTAIGNDALHLNTTGYENVAGGHKALFANSTGVRNVAVGTNSLNSSSSGSYNTALGDHSLDENYTGSYNTAVGHNSGPGNGYTALENSGSFGNFANTTASNQIRIGNSSILSIGGYTNWTNLSDGNFKKNIHENVAGLDFILKLRPVTYNLDVSRVDEYLGNTQFIENDKTLLEARENKSNFVQSGFIAQEVEKAAREAGYDFSGVDVPKNENDLYGLRYAEFVVPMVKAMQEQQKIIEALQDRIEILEQINTK